MKFREVEKITNTTIKTAGFSSTWEDNSRFRNHNLTNVSKQELKKKHYDHLVISAPTVDISNLKTDNLKPNDDTKELKDKVKESCRNVVKIAEDALAECDGLKNVTIMKASNSSNGLQII